MVSFLLDDIYVVGDPIVVYALPQRPGKELNYMERVKANFNVQGMIAVAVLAVAGLTLPTAQAATSLGEAESWNAFIFGDLTARADTEGKLAVGGNMHTPSGYSVGIGTGFGPSLPETYGAEDHLVVAGDITGAQNWPVRGGNARIGGTVTNGITTQGSSANQIYQNVGAANVGIDFAAAQADLTAKSQYWGSLEQTGTVSTDPWNTEITLSGSGDLVVFNLVGDALDHINRSIEVDQGATVLINISGQNPRMESWNFSVNGETSVQAMTSEANILFNFFEAETLAIGQTQVPGSVLAPNAHLTLSGGGINGQTIVASAEQRWGGQFNNFLFEGDLPEPPGGGAMIPSPAAVWGGLSLIFAGLLRRHRPRK